MVSIGFLSQLQQPTAAGPTRALPRVTVTRVALPWPEFPEVVELFYLIDSE
jgi:hypothetical protein